MELKMYYKNKNISYSQKLLNPVIKYKKCTGKGDCYTTKSGLKTDQKVYKNRAKTALIAYIKKEGNNFYSKKQIKKTEGIKHLIISPIDPVLYNKLDKKEKEKLKNIVIKDIYKNLSRFGFIGGIEEKDRKVGDENYEHFHIHLGISEKYDISPQNIDYIKRSITKAILSEPQLKNKLGLKTSNELKKETWHKKTQKIYLDKAKEYLKIKNAFEEIKELSKEKNILINENKKDFENIKWLSENKRTELSAINKQKEFLIFDIKSTASILKTRHNELKNINYNFELLNKEMKNANNIAFYKLNQELKDYQNYLNDDLKYFTQVLKFEHNIYVKYLKQQLKNKKIDLPRFLYLVAVNKHYINNRKKAKEEEIKFKIKQKEQEIKQELSNIYRKYIEKFNKLKNKKSYIEFINKFDENKLHTLQNKLNQIKQDKNNLNAYYNLRIKTILQYIAERQQKYKELNYKQQQKAEQITHHKSNINNYKNKEELKNTFGLSKNEFNKVKQQYQEDKKQHADINFNNYVKAYIRNKQRKNANQNYKHDINLDM